MPRRNPDSSALAPFHPIVRDWFRETLGEPSAPQKAGWPAIAAGGHTLILAPTGTGKTLTAFLWELNALITDGLREPLPNAVRILYVSPLKALGNDIERNLQQPLEQLRERFAAVAEPFPDIRVAVRTGDTPSSARARMLRKAPHVLITTPESLHIMLTSVRGRGMFSGVRAVIVDEIHALAGTKRGAHLALTLERLEPLCEAPPQRIGLSATQRPLEETAKFLGGCDARAPDDEPRFRPVHVVDCGLVKPLDLAIESPVADLGNVGGTIWPAVVPLVLRRMAEARTTLVFVNNRGQAERMAARLNAAAEQEVALPYHGSLSRERRLLLEQRLKAGDVRALVTTSALEMGIDIGSVDLVLQLQSPKRVSTALQRVGRAGHTLTAVSRGVLVPTFRDDAMEQLAIVRGMRAGDVEPTRVVQNALDVLAQVLVAAASVDDWTSADLFALVRRAYPYHALTRGAFDEVLALLAGKYPADVAAELDARLTWDRTTDQVRAPTGSRFVAVTSGGTIPDRGYYTVNLPDRTRLGELDEEFVHETRIGDVFQLGSSTWRVQAIEHDRVIVIPAPGAPARMPFWHGELAARSSHLAPRVGELRRALAECDPDDDAAVARISLAYECDHATARSMIDYVREQRAATGSVPDDRSLVAEQFRDETGSVRVVLHAPFGARVNAPWAMALAQRYRERLRDMGGRAAGRGMEVEVLTTDDGIMLRLPALLADAPTDPLRGLTPPEAERRVLEEVGDSSLFGARFRMNAARALLLPRGGPRRRMPLWLQRLKAQDLLQAVREYPSFPILVETYRDVLQDAFDMRALADVLSGLERGTITLRTVVTEAPSPFAASLQFGFVMDWMYGDDTPRAERRAAMLSLDRALLDEVLGDDAAVDDATLAGLEELAAERRGTAPSRRARTADELAILLDRAGDLTQEELAARVATPEEGRQRDPLADLLASGRVVGLPLHADRAPHLVLAENVPRYVAAFGTRVVETVYAGPGLEPRAGSDALDAAFREPAITEAAARREVLARWVATAGAFRTVDVTARYPLPESWVAARLDDWARAGTLVRLGTGPGARWASRRLLERARKRELARARAAVQPVPFAALVAFLQRWQHLHPDTRLAGRDGTVDAVRQLYGIPRPAGAWEHDYLRRRVDGYDAAALSQLGAAGELVWVGTAPADPGRAGTLSGVRFVRRGTGRAWLAESPDAVASERAQRVLDALKAEGASFVEDLATATALGQAGVRDALYELVARGLVTNDTIEGLRAVARWRPVFGSGSGRDAPDPTRWLPEDFVRSRPIVQRRPNVRRLPKWRPPGHSRAGVDPLAWPGRWSLVRTAGTLGPPRDESELAEEVARQWLGRYGVVSRDWWRRERPAVAWRAIYRELRGLELRGEVRRGWFVRGLAGIQFALPDAVEALRAERGASDPAVAMSVTDPANAWALPKDVARSGEHAPDAIARPRARDAVLVTIAGDVVLAAQSRGRRVSVREGVRAADVTAAARALIEHVSQRGDRRRDLSVETIDGAPAAASAWTDAFVAAGFRLAGSVLRWYA